MDKKKSTLIQKNSKKSADSLLARQKLLKLKLASLKSKKASESSNHIQPTPKINSNSRRLASKSQSSLITSQTRMLRTHKILKNSRFLPKTVKMSLTSLKSIPKSFNPSPKLLRYDSVFTSPLPNSPITFPSIKNLTVLTTPDAFEDFPEDISKRNKLLLSHKNEFETQLQEQKCLQLTFEERTQLWMKKKMQKVESLRSESESKEMEKCSFKPSFASVIGSRRTTAKAMSSRSSSCVKGKRNRSQVSLSSGRTSVVSCKSEDSLRVHKQFRTSGSSSTILNNICPINMNVSYRSGFSDSLIKKSKPMISYKVLSIKP